MIEKFYITTTESIALDERAVNAIKTIIEIKSNKKKFVLKDGKLEELINHNTSYDYIIMEKKHE